MYKDPKIKRYELLPHVEICDIGKTFDLIDDFSDIISPYIYTNIKITDYTESIETAFQSRLQQVMSEILLRSLRLKDGMVSALNEGNFPAYYASLKSFLEIPAVLGYIAYTISENDDYKENWC